MCESANQISGELRQGGLFWGTIFHVNEQMYYVGIYGNKNQEMTGFSKLGLCVLQYYSENRQ